jgi:hypothetical protein
VGKPEPLHIADCPLCHKAHDYTININRVDGAVTVGDTQIVDQIFSGRPIAKALQGYKEETLFLDCPETKKTYKATIRLDLSFQPVEPQKGE